jgi:hypothetical protein
VTEPKGGGSGGKGRARRAWIRLAVLLYGGATALAWLWRTALRGESLLLADPAHPVAWVRDLAAGVAAGLLVLAASEVLTRSTEMGRALAQALGALLGRLRDREVLALAALSGIGEEAFFRGALQPEIGLVGATLAFGLAHFVPRRELLPWTGFALAAGLLFGILYERTGNLVAPVVAHALVNAVNLRRLSREYGGA